MRNKYRGADIRARLGSTVIRYKNKPYYCEVDGEQVVLMDLITRNTVHRKTADDPDLDVSSMDLGYVNIENPRNVAVYVKRLPRRMYKQGIDLSALSYHALTLPANRFSVGQDNMWCKGFVDSYEGNFPTFSQAIKFLTDGKRYSVAITRDVALLRDKDTVKVYVKDDEVAWLRLGTKQVIVPKGDCSWVTVLQLEIASSEWQVQEGY